MNTENETRETPGLVKVTQNTENTTAEIKSAADPQFVPRPVKAADPQSAARFKELVPTAFGFAVLFLLAIYKNEAGAAYTAMVAGMFALFKAVEDATRKLTLKAPRSDGSAPAAREASTAAPAAPASNRPYRLFLMIICILLSVSVWTTASSTLQFLDRCLIQLLAAVWLLLGRFPAAGWGPGQYILGVLHVICTPLAQLFVPFRDLANYARQSTRGDKSKSRALPAILLGLAIACPILIFVLTLLSEADSVFAHLLHSITLNFTIPEFLQDCIPVLFDLVFAFILFYTLAHFFCGQGDPHIHIESGKRTANPLTAITVLAVLTAVYAVFCGIQVIYLLGRRPLPDGITYAAYAHEGFYQLAAVCFLNLALVIICENTFRQHRVLSALMLIMSCCTYIMIASSAARMILYISAYDLTFLRVFVLWFLAALTVCLTAVCAGILNPKVPVFRISLGAVAVLFLAFALAHPDYWIARYNVSAYQRGRSLDKTYIVYNLSDDAAPVIAQNAELLKMKKDSIEDDRAFHEMENDEWWYDTFLNQIRIFNASEAAARRYYGG